MLVSVSVSVLVSVSVHTFPLVVTLFFDTMTINKFPVPQQNHDHCQEEEGEEGEEGGGGGG